MLLVVNYHYIVRTRGAGASVTFPVTVDELAAQLDVLARDFEFVSCGDVVDAAAGGRPLPDRSCLVTFDDGLRGQVELALPVLDERRIPAVFFVCGRPLAERRVLFVHKVHALRETMGDEGLRDVLAPYLEELTPDGEVPVEVAVAHYRYDVPATAQLKYALNHLLGPQRPEAVDALFAERFEEGETAGRLYATPGQVSELAERGFLGGHGYTHRPLAALDIVAAREDVDRCGSALEAVAGRRPRAFSYPYGTAAAVTRPVADAVRACGFSVGFTLERAFNATLGDPLLLARLDANDAPGGRRPVFSVERGGIELRGAMTPARTRYLEEVAA